MSNSFRARSTLNCGDRTYEIWSLAALPQDKVARLPYALKVLLENLLRFEDGVSVTRADIEALLEWDPAATPSHEIAFTPARVILQDFTGVPCVVAEEPLLCVARGTGIALDNLEEYKRSLVAVK